MDLIGFESMTLSHNYFSLSLSQDINSFECVINLKSILLIDLLFELFRTCETTSVVVYIFVIFYVKDFFFFFLNRVEKYIRFKKIKKTKKKYETNLFFKCHISYV